MKQDPYITANTVISFYLNLISPVVLTAYYESVAFELKKLFLGHLILIRMFKYVLKSFSPGINSGPLYHGIFPCQYYR